MPQSSTKSAEPEPHLIFTYGTLKQGFPNHPLMQDLFRLDDAVLLGSTCLTHRPHPLVCGPHGIPYLINLPGLGNRIKGELYSVSTRGLARLDELEGIEIGHYERFPLRVENGGVLVDAEAYYAHRSFGERLWKSKGESGLTEYTLKEASGYVRRKDRPEGANIVRDLNLFIHSSCGNGEQ